MPASADVIRDILKDSNYALSLFSEGEINALRGKAFSKEVRGKQVVFVTCVVRNKDIQLKPEEIVRQLYATRLIEQYGYAKKRLCFEYKVTFGREKKSAVNGVADDDFRVMEFRNSGQTDTELKQKIQTLFDQAKSQWPGVFADSDSFQLSDSHLAVCISSLQNVKLFNSNLLVVDEAFEYLVNKSAKGEKGQYFTPRHVIDMCVKMLNPKPGEHMIDTASGSCGFPVHTIFQITGQLFTNAAISEQDKQHVLKIFGIDFDEKTVCVARTLNLIAGDGETNVLHLNTLDFERWADKSDKDKNGSEPTPRGFSDWRSSGRRKVKTDDSILIC